MFRICYKLLLVTCILTISYAQAYGEDTHFSGTYAMARYAGIRHEVAVKMAHFDASGLHESYISDPTSMILLVPDGMKKRRLLSLSRSSRNLGTVTIETQAHIFGFETLEQKNEEVINVILTQFMTSDAEDGKT